MNDRTSQNWLERIRKFCSSEPKNRSQLISLLRNAARHAVLDNDSLKMLEGVLRVSEMKVRDVMVPRPQMIVIEGSATPQSILPIIVESGHSRFPVLGENRDEILGILLAKDLLKFQQK